ncbi:MAG: hypothetical protein KIS77_13040 [Saprospiraceae bacterium]|nr:hypothetical protein [Saprospiraceae bacterium]
MKNSIWHILLYALIITAPLANIAAQNESKEKTVFTFPNNTGQDANDLHILLSEGTPPVNIEKVMGIEKVGGIFSDFPREGKSPQDYAGGTVANGSSITIQFKEKTKVRSWYWTRDGKRIGEIQQGALVSVPDLPESALVCSATGTGRTTGHIATLALYNPTNQAVTTEVGPFFIPSDGQHQPYVVPNVTPVTVQPGSTVNVPLQGYCADIHTPPVPANGTMPPVKDWISPGSLPADWMPSNANGWKPAAGSSALNPGTSNPLGHTIDLVKHPKEAAPVLLEALTRITAAYDGMKSSGNISTPFSGNPDKERESVIQQTFWIYAAELTGTGYKIDDFSKNTVKQYEAATGQNYQKQPAETQNQVQGGVVDFWNTFQAVGNEAKVIKKEPDYLLCYDKKGCAAGSYLGSVKTEADCKAVGGKSVRKGLFGDCKDLK